MSAQYPSSKPRLRASCDGCFLAKVKCSKARPICTRCLQVGLICRYSPSSRTAGGTGGPSTTSGRARPNRQLMASTLSDESCEDLGRWLSQQWAAADHQDASVHPTGTNMSMWHGSQAGLVAANRAGQAQGGATVPVGSHNATANNGGSAGVLNHESLVLSPVGWASYQAPSYPVGPPSSYGSMPNSAQSFPAQPSPWAATFEASSMNTPNQNTPLPPPLPSYHHHQQHGAERFRPQSCSDSSTSVSAASSDISEWTMAYWHTQQEFRVPFDCEPSDTSEHQAWDTNDFMNNHH